MKVVRVVFDDESCETYLRDPRTLGGFLRGVECNENGIAVRGEGCTEDAELLIRTSRIVKTEEVRDG